MANAPKPPGKPSVPKLVPGAKAKTPDAETARAADSAPVPVGPFAVLPTQFGRYRVEKLLGKGAMGAVYLAHDSQLDRPVALKIARVSAAGSAKLIQRMETEAKAAAKVDHPQICKVYDFGEVDGIRFIALQYIEGEDLKSYLKRVDRIREPAEAIRLVLQIAHALQAAHAKDVIHRDLKPENIMLNKKGEPVIMDFGLARRLSGTTNAGLTQGMILGTAAYMSPEQAIGKAEGIDQRSDLYALGVMLFEMLTGEWPFKGSAIEVMGRKCVQDAPSPLSLRPDLPPRLAEVCHKMIAQKKEDRYASCAELIAALEAVSLEQTPASPPVVTHDTQLLNTEQIPEIVFKEFEPAPKTKKKSPLPKPAASAVWWRRRSSALYAILLGLFGMVAALLIAIPLRRVPQGFVRIAVSDPGVEVLVDGAKAPPANPQTGHPLRVGSHQLTLQVNDKVIPLTDGLKLEIDGQPRLVLAEMNGARLSSDLFQVDRDQVTDVKIHIHPADYAVEIEPGKEWLKNGSCEDQMVGGKIPDWTYVAGFWRTGGFDNWVPPVTDENGRPIPAGKGVFYPGDCAYAELYQDVNVEKLSSLVTKGRARCNFSCYTASAAQSPPDQGRIIVEFRDAANQKILGSLDSFENASSAKWRKLELRGNIPQQTQWIRVRMMARRYGSNTKSNDALFDLVSLRIFQTF